MSYAEQTKPGFWIIQNMSMWYVNGASKDLYYYKTPQATTGGALVQRLDTEAY